MKNMNFNFSRALLVAALLHLVPLVLLAQQESANGPDGVGVQGSAQASSQASSPNNSKKKKSTEVSFEDVLVQGKYHFSDEAVTTVEDDKILDALLGVRTDFKDRLKRSSARH